MPRKSQLLAATGLPGDDLSSASGCSTPAQARGTIHANLTDIHKMSSDTTLYTSGSQLRIVSLNRGRQCIDRSLRISTRISSDLSFELSNLGRLCINLGLNR